MTSTTGNNGNNDRINLQGFNVDFVGNPATRLGDMLFGNDGALQIGTVMKLYNLAQQTPGGTLDLDALAELDPSLLRQFGISEDVVQALVASKAPQAPAAAKPSRHGSPASPVASASPALTPVPASKATPVQCQVYVWADAADRKKGTTPVPGLVFDENQARAYVNLNGGKLVRNKGQYAIIPSNADVNTNDGWVLA